MRLLVLSITLLALVLNACGEKKTGPVAIHYDRDTCEQCRMIISDPHYATEVRDQNGAVHLFDDPGGAIVWLSQHDQDTAHTEIWVMNMRDGKTWLNARTAWFLPTGATPMDFGYGAVATAEDGAIDFGAFRTAILANRTRGASQ